MLAPEEEFTKQGTVKHVKTGIDKARLQLEKLMKDPAKPVVLPEPPKEKTIRPPREMVKNVQGSSAGAGSGEFHVYKASRRREYERLKLMEDEKAKEELTAETERKRKEREEQAEAKTAKNRAKREKKKAARLKGKNKTKPNGDEQAMNHDNEDSSGSESRPAEDQPFKKRRLVAPVMVTNTDDQEQLDETVSFMSPESRPPTISTVVASVVIHDED